MKKLGIILLTTGVVLMLIAAFNFVKDKKRWSEGNAIKTNHPFPWVPSLSAVLIAAGIISITSSKSLKSK